MAAPTHKRFARSSAGEQSHLATGSSRRAATVDSLHRFGPMVQPASAFDPACRSGHHPGTRRENPHCLAAVPLASRRNLLTRCSPTAAFEAPELRPAAVRTNALPPGSGTGHHPAAAVAPRLVTGIEGPIPSVSGVTRRRLRMCPARARSYSPAAGHVPTATRRGCWRLVRRESSPATMETSESLSGPSSSFKTPSRTTTAVLLFI